MAKVYHVPTKVGFNSAVAAGTATTISSTTDGGFVLVDGSYTSGGTTSTVHAKDEGLILILANSDSSDAVVATIKGSGSFLGGNDIAVSVPASGSKVIRVDGGYRIMEGTDKGYIKILPATANKISVVAYYLK